MCLLTCIVKGIVGYVNTITQKKTVAESRRTTREILQELNLVAATSQETPLDEQDGFISPRVRQLYNKLTEYFICAHTHPHTHTNHSIVFIYSEENQPSARDFAAVAGSSVQGSECKT